MVTFTLFRNSDGNPLSKTYSLIDGGIAKRPAANMTTGTATRMSVPFEEFGAILDEADAAVAFSYCCHDETFGNVVNICLAGQEDKSKLRISRTAEYYTYRSEPGILMIDHDPEPGVAPWSSEALLSELKRICPALASVKMLIRGSLSSSVKVAGTDATPHGGYHIYIPVLDASDIPRTGKVLTQRLWLSGHGWIKIGAAGTLLARSPIDASVYSLARLDFVGRPVIGEGLEWVAPKTVTISGSYLDTHAAVHDLSDDEEARYNSLLSSAKRKLSRASKDVREQWVSERCTGPDGEALKKDLSDWKHGEMLHLPASFVLYPAGEPVSVSTVLANPDKYKGMEIQDPLRAPHDRLRAKIYLNGDGSIKINSFAGGGTLYHLGEPTKDLQDRIDALNADHGCIYLGSKLYIAAWVTDPDGQRTVDFRKPQDFKIQFGNERHKKKGLGELWLTSPQRRDYKGVVFSPNGCSEDYLNLYRGLATTPKPGTWTKMYLHIRDVICSGDKNLCKYVLSWLAHTVQQPGGERPGVAIVLRGKQGTGKGTLVNQFGKIFGGHYLHITTQSQLTGHFNGHLKNSLLVFADEGIWAGDKQAEGRLKALITEDKIMIEPKGIDPFMIDNHMRLFIATNNDWAIPAGIEERRFLVLDVADTHMQDHAYFAAIKDEMDNGGREAMLSALLSADLSSINLRKPPRTEALVDQIEKSMSSAQKFWLETLRDGRLHPSHNGWEGKVTCKQMYEQYTEFAKLIGDKHPATDKSFGKELRKLTHVVRERKFLYGYRPWCYTFEPLEKCRSLYEVSVKCLIDWAE